MSKLVLVLYRALPHLLQSEEKRDRPRILKVKEVTGMRMQHLAVTAMALLLVGPSLATPSRADFVKTKPAKTRPAAATRTVTFDLTGMD